MSVPVGARREVFLNRATRRKMRDDSAAPKKTNYHRRWDVLRVDKTARPENRRYDGKSLAEVAALRGQDPLDALLDLALEEDLATVFWNATTAATRTPWARSSAARTS